MSVSLRSLAFALGLLVFSGTAVNGFGQSHPSQAKSTQSSTLRVVPFGTMENASPIAEANEQVSVRTVSAKSPQVQKTQAQTAQVKTAQVAKSSAKTVSSKTSKVVTKASKANCPSCTSAPSHVVSHHGCTACGSSRRGPQGPGLGTRLKYKYDNYWKYSLQESHWGYPEEFCEKPFGYWVYAHARTQVANGEAARMVLHHMDFEQCSDELTVRGRQQLAKIAYMLPRNFFPIVIEHTPYDPTLAVRRRARVLEVLQAGNFPVPAERIVVAPNVGLGRNGIEAEPQNALMGTILEQGGAEAPFSTIISETQTSFE